ncbi:hypothetical protein HK104_009967 [Borealophlyctis nickersoniae]|nr:hypothetical protein HK104_009967 [Borealophlyctis nickersoniae]
MSDTAKKPKACWVAARDAFLVEEIMEATCMGKRADSGFKKGSMRPCHRPLQQAFSRDIDKGSTKELYAIDQLAELYEGVGATGQWASSPHTGKKETHASEEPIEQELLAHCNKDLVNCPSTGYPMDTFFDCAYASTIVDTRQLQLQPPYVVAYRIPKH